MIKTIRFFGIFIICLANLFGFLSTALKFMIFISFFMGIFMGVLIGFLGLLTPDYSFYGHIGWNILATTIGIGLVYLSWDKIKTEDSKYYRNLENHNKNK